MSNRQPSSLHCFVCGVANPFGLHIKFHETAPGEVTAQVNLPDEFQGYPGIAHGGVVAAMLDEAAGRSQMGDIKDPRFMFTAKLDISYRSNVPTGQPLRLIGNALECRGRKATARAAIYNLEGKLLAEANALMIRIPEQILNSVDIEALGWKVYPDE